jgi:hypothetical protein
MFKVRWQRRALDELANCWLHADSASRHAITAASQDIDQRLRQDPSHEGESRSRGRRITFVPPLAVVFRVDVGRNNVSVLQVRLFRRRGH